MTTRRPGPGQPSPGNDLFPPVEPHTAGHLAVDETHRLYWEECGDPAGMPVLFLHGGPGAGCSPVHRRFFNPRHYRIILLDQRGSGRSEPAGSLMDNTTPHLVADMEHLRRHLGVGAWLLFGGSWGSTLALAYGLAHPERCLGFILRGVFLGSDSEIAWFLHGMGRFFPAAARRFLTFLPEGERDDPLEAYYARLLDPEPSVHMPAALAWCRYEEACSTLIPPEVSHVSAGPGTLAMARVESHYFRHGAFLGDTPLLHRVAALTHLPATIVQGRYDMVCPLLTAEHLHRAWSGSRLTVVPDAGHSALEPGLRSALVAATERFLEAA